MTLLLLCIGWVFASAAVAMLPMRYQYVPGLALLVAAPVLIAMIWVQLSPWAALAAIAAFVSMYRNPLRYFWQKLRGQNPERPPE
jgi:hypothetical protein